MGYGPRADGTAVTKDMEITVTKPSWRDQPRVPAGSSDGGQWTDGDGGDGGAFSGIGEAISQTLQTVVAGVLKDLAIRALSKLFRLPKSPSAPKPSAPEPSAPPLVEPTVPSTRELLKPAGRGVGSKGSSTRTRIIGRDESAALQKELMAGAREAPELVPGYEGRVFQRPDWIVAGLRKSVRNGDTLEVLLSDDPGLKEGFKVHRP